MSTLGIFLLGYGIVALSHILLQILLAHLEYRRQSRIDADEYRDYRPFVSVIVPVYNELPESLEQCISSIYDQNYRKLELIIVDDGSTNAKELKKKVYDNFNAGRARTLMLKQNVGKRHAQKEAFEVAKGEILVTVDSDTILHDKDVITTLVRRFQDPDVGAVTGDVWVENEKTNLLTRLISRRYWMAFNQERASQSYFNVLMCCSGPFSAYRKSVIDDVKEAYVSQRFFGKLCTFGDDRHLTNLVLVEGYDAVYEKDARAFTYVPETIGGYIRQQIRWNKSFYRESIWTFKSISKHHPYLLYELVMQLILPFLLMFALGYTIYEAVNGNTDVLIGYALIVSLIALLRTSYGAWRTQNAGFALFIIYGFLYVTVLIPVRLYALATLPNTKWGTR